MDLTKDLENYKKNRRILKMDLAEARKLPATPEQIADIKEMENALSREKKAAEALIADALRDMDIPGMLEDLKPAILRKIENRIKNMILSAGLITTNEIHYMRGQKESILIFNPEKIWDKEELSVYNAGECADTMLAFFPALFDRALEGVGKQILLSRNEDISRTRNQCRYCSLDFDRALEKEIKKFDFQELLPEMTYSRDDFLILLGNNKKYRRAVKLFIKQGGTSIKDNILRLTAIEYPDMYPLARKMKRHFILHIGPTNSGKTHDALEALKKAESGVYLGPLRLLAYEKYEELNACQVSCSMITGEEEIITENARIVASTIEMLNFDKEYDTAVIDEAQMIADINRGGSWTAAILGCAAKEIHICCAPEAEYIVTQLIRECHDSMEITRHSRFTDLVMEDAPFNFPADVREKDAYVVFSRRNVHAVAAELQRMGHKCSIIYGALPYDVRRQETERFIKGETDVVVATDAIGMGLNLPIRRIVFLEASKFDGVEVRELNAGEVRQIAGRAGRYGIFEEGFVNIDESTEFKEDLVRLLDEDIENIPLARLDFPRALLEIDAPLSVLMRKWSLLEGRGHYIKEDISIKISLARTLEEISDDKELIYRFVCIPFDEENKVLKTIWYHMFLTELQGEHVNIDDFIPYTLEGMDLSDLELEYKKCDLLYYYVSDFCAHKDADRTIMVKLEISRCILKKLKDQKLEAKRCRQCHRILPWNYAFRLCERCNSARRNRTVKKKIIPAPQPEHPQSNHHRRKKRSR